MFSAFTSIDHPSARARTASEAALQRLDGIGHVLSDIDLSAIKTQEDLARTLLTLETADKCVRAIRAEFRTEAASDRLVRKARNLMQLIARARDDLTGWRAVTS